MCQLDAMVWATRLMGGRLILLRLSEKESSIFWNPSRFQHARPHIEERSCGVFHVERNLETPIETKE